MGSTHPHAPRGEALRSQDCRDRRAPPSGLPADVSLGLAIAMADTITCRVWVILMSVTLQAVDIPPSVCRRCVY